jgi:hypothetical protein
VIDLARSLSERRRFEESEELFRKAAQIDPESPKLMFAHALPRLMPLPWPQTLAILGYAVISCLVVNDAVRVVMIKWRVPTAIA